MIARFLSPCNNDSSNVGPARNPRPTVLPCHAVSRIESARLRYSYIHAAIFKRASELCRKSGTEARRRLACEQGSPSRRLCDYQASTRHDARQHRTRHIQVRLLALLLCIGNSSIGSSKADSVCTNSAALSVYDGRRFQQIGASKIHNPRQLVFTLDHDVQNKSSKNLEKYSKIEAFGNQHGVDFYPAGRGIGHQIMIEEGYAFPGQLTV
jgi:hypothetical protein